MHHTDRDRDNLRLACGETGAYDTLERRLTAYAAARAAWPVGYDRLVDLFLSRAQDDLRRHVARLGPTIAGGVEFSDRGGRLYQSVPMRAVEMLNRR